MYASTLAQCRAYVNMYSLCFYGDKTVAYIQLVLYYRYQAPEVSTSNENDHICEIGRFLLNRDKHPTVLSYKAKGRPFGRPKRIIRHRASFPLTQYNRR